MERPIVRLGAEVLLKVAEPVENITQAEIDLVRDMVETMYQAKGIGLAATQVRVSKRVLVFFLPAERDQPSGQGIPLTVLINPEVIPVDEVDTNVDFEGCLSVPGVRGRVRRWSRVRYTGWTAGGERLQREAEGWHARVVQHELDHLNGVLYPALLAEEDRLLSLDEWRALQ